MSTIDRHFPDEQWAHLINASERLATTRSLDAVVDVLRETARRIVQAEGIAVVIRDGDHCFYAAEDSVSPLWAGQRFPAETCISGWAMMNRETATIPDVRLDARIPQEAYRPTFVRSLVMVPIGAAEPVAALGAYWAEVREHERRTIALLQALARAASIALENARLMRALEDSNRQVRELAGTLERRVEERTRELTRTQEALRQAQKLEAMGQLTGGVAHDFNNLLTPIMGSLDLLSRRISGDDRERRLIQAALASAERAKSLVQRLLAFARRQPLRVSAVDIRALLTGMSQLLRTTLGSQIDLTFSFAADRLVALADPHQVEIAILNLVLNARDAMPAGGKLAIAAAIDRIGDDHAAGLRPGDYIRLAITDTGAGMDEETRARAIEPFYSTKGVGKGTGLGLSMAHGLASQLGGALAISSRPGTGTTIELWLPMGAAQDSRATASHGTAAAACNGITALVVDDEDLVRATTAEMLIDLGYRVIEARSGAEALERLGSDAAISILVTDQVMPSMTGVELARQARGRHPNLKVLLISGYAEFDQLPAALPRLNKPFRQADLAASLGLDETTAVLPD